MALDVITTNFGPIPPVSRTLTITGPFANLATLPNYKHGSIDQGPTGTFTLLCYKVADNMAYIFQSNDWCRSFVQVSSGAIWDGANRMNAQIFGLDGSGFISSAVDVYGSQAYVKFSPDGIDWSTPEMAVAAMTNGSRFFHVWQCVPAYGIRLFGSDGFIIHYSDDYGKTWQALNTQPCWTPADGDATHLIEGASPFISNTEDGQFIGAINVLTPSPMTPPLYISGGTSTGYFRLSADGIDWSKPYTTFLIENRGFYTQTTKRMTRIVQAYIAHSTRLFADVEQVSNDYGKTWGELF